MPLKNSFCPSSLLNYTPGFFFLTYVEANIRRAGNLSIFWSRLCTESLEEFFVFKIFLCIAYVLGGALHKISFDNFHWGL